jgi:hypothetical protein
MDGAGAMLGSTEHFRAKHFPEKPFAAADYERGRLKGGSFKRGRVNIPSG